MKLAKISQNIARIVQKTDFWRVWNLMQILGCKKRDKNLEKWGTSASRHPAALRAGAMGKGREGDKSPYQGLGRKGFIDLRS